MKFSLKSHWVAVPPKVEGGRVAGWGLVCGTDTTEFVKEFIPRQVLREEF